MRISGSDLRLLQVFGSVVRHGGFAAAEHELNISQSTISNHMTALEERFGFVLCQRGRGGFRLTSKGEAVFDASGRLDKAMQDFSADVAALRGQMRGELRVGIVDAIVDDPANHLPQAIADFGTIAGEVQVTLIQERPQDLQAKVREGVYDCGIGSFPTRVDGLDYERLYVEEHGLYCGSKHPLFAGGDGVVSDETLSEQPFVHRGYWREEGGFRQIPWRVEATVFQMEPQLLLVLSGRYIGFLPHHYVASRVADGQLRRLCPDRIGYACDFELISARTRRKSDIATGFMESVRTAWKTA
ncbi:MAG: LysR family transcriptional regulator [Rhizobiaceae bacterium]|nr:LysR family transcriptional regulator [Rhizobiaceae bacterium]